MDNSFKKKNETDEKADWIDGQEINLLTVVDR